MKLAHAGPSGSPAWSRRLRSSCSSRRHRRFRCDGDPDRASAAARCPVPAARPSRAAVNQAPPRRCRRPPAAGRRPRGLQERQGADATSRRRVHAPAARRSPHWVSPKQGCGFCHAGNDYASDAKPHEARPRADAAHDPPHQRRLAEPRRPARASPATPAIAASRCRPRSGSRARRSRSTRSSPSRSNWNEAADTVRNFFPDAGLAEYYLRRRADLGAVHDGAAERHRVAADRGQAHLRDDDADVGRHRRQLRLLPQLPRLPTGRRARRPAGSATPASS